MDNKKAVESPDHYTAGGMEVIDIIRAKLTHAEYKGYLKGNVLKYLFRYPHKDGPLDLDKASKYMEWLKQAEANRDGGMPSTAVGRLRVAERIEKQKAEDLRKNKEVDAIDALSGISCFSKGSLVEEPPYISGLWRASRFADELKKESICTCGRGDK